MKPRLPVVVILCASFAGAVGIGWLFGLPELTALAVGSAAVALLCGSHLTWGPPVPRTEATASPRAVRRGEPARLELRLSNPSSSRTRPITLAGGFGPAGRGSIAIGAIAPQESTALAIEVPTAHRGVFGFGPLELRTSDPLRVWKRITSQPTTTLLVVHPRVHTLPGLFHRGTDQLGTGRPAAAIQRGPDAEVDLAGLRPYVPGDDLRRIHWRTSARRNQPHVVQVEPPLGPAPVVVLVDTRAGSCGSERFELTVEAAASICAAAIDGGMPVRLTTTGGTGAHYPATPSGLSDALDLLAALGQGQAGDPRTQLRQLDASTRSVFVCTGDPAVARDPAVTRDARVVCWDGSAALGAALGAGVGAGVDAGIGAGVDAGIGAGVGEAIRSGVTDGTRGVARGVERGEQ